MRWPAQTAGAPTLILLHGIARDAHRFDHIAPQLGRKYDVLSLDMRGHGDSVWSRDGGAWSKSTSSTWRRSWIGWG